LSATASAKVAWLYDDTETDTNSDSNNAVDAVLAAY